MSRITKLFAAVGTVVALVTVFTPGLYAISHSQALTNVLLGQFAALATGHTAYRLSSGKRPALRSTVVGIVCGIGVAISPIVFELVTGFTTVTMFSGGFVAAVGVYGIYANLTTEEEQRIPDLSTDQTPDEGAKAA